MHSVVETPSFLADAKAAGLSDDERLALVDFIAAHPDAGDEIPGSGGARKLRLAGRGKGKSGGYRVITFYSGDGVPVFLLNVFSKGERANLSKAEVNALRVILGQIVALYKARSRSS
ncbi:MAG: type II toxin-antitoxin system RelE/ParE family toxin [Methylocystis sp.]|nr:type II toxin-antitoxin system RelE/ParE family toxin [Methylocystis sp.]MCA3583236.1 type II toxin-antitoxin system RelE/ParE family toxin [Methylocystis sp.]MCA3587559.1 type II toxin-antitoxin system RelE/ParE family toxin [Methylocystis sp.]MCA3590686.1 type II toxin-antitoxin system RelE/ParE family toxin [Methylocystis sp.]